MMACNRRAKACAVTVRMQWVSAVSPPDRRFHPNSDSTASLLGNADSGHCTRQGCTRPYPGKGYAHQLPDREDYGEELEMRISTSLIEQDPVGRAHLSEPCTVYTLPLDYKRENVLVRKKVPGCTHTSLCCFPFRLTQPIQHQSGRRVLRSGGLNHSKSSCPSCVHLSTDRALLSLLQTHS
jgi:hypothetical protein